MQLKTVEKTTDDSNLIPLINIVFLLLIFFLVATIIRPFESKNIKLSNSTNEEKLHKITHRIIIDKTGALNVKGNIVTIEDLPSLFQSNDQDSANHTLNIIADKDLAADKLLDIVSKLGELDLNDIKLVTERTKK